MIHAAATTSKILAAGNVSFAMPGEIKAWANLEAAGTKPATFTMEAYNGGLLRVAGFDLPIVVDLRGLTPLKAKTSIRKDHETLIGHTEKLNIGMTSITASGVLSISNEESRQIVEASKNGFQWQASIGAMVVTKEYIRAGQTVNVNGQTFTGPIYVARTSKLLEITIVDLGADTSTAVNIAATGTNMTFEDFLKAQGIDIATLTDAGKATLQASFNAQQTVEPPAPADPATAERLRAASVMQICAGFPTLAAQAVADGWDENRAKSEALSTLRAGRASFAPVANQRTNSAVRPGSIIEAAFLGHAGYESLGEKSLGAEVMAHAKQLRCRSLVDICAAALRQQGVESPMSRNALITAALSTTSLPTALGNAANKILLQAYNESPATWQAFATIKPAANFKPQTSVRPNISGSLDQLAKGGGIKHATMSEATYQWAIDTFAKMLGIDRQDIINDDLGLFNDSAMGLGRMARRSLSDFVWKTILANAGSFFSAGNANYDEGTGTALSVTSLAAGITAMRQQRDADNNDLDIMPKVLAVPPELETTAKGILQSEYIQLLATATGPTGNTVKNAVTLQVEPRLSNSEKFTGTSAKAWYLFGGPADGAVTVGFLDGQQSPTVEFFGLNAEPSVLQAQWRVYHDYGAALSEPRAAYKAKGEA